MYGEPGGLDGAVTLPQLLKQLGYVTQGVGKWHMGENEGSLPQNVGYDDYRGFLGVSDMYTEWRDVYFNPEVALSPARFAMMEKSPFDHDEVHCTPEDRKACRSVRLIDLDVIKELDTRLDGLRRGLHPSQKGASKPFFLYLRHARLPLRQLPDRRMGGPVAAPGPPTATAWWRWTTCWADGRRAGGDRPDGEHPRPLHLRQRPGVRDPAPRPYRPSAAARGRAGRAACGCRPSPTGRA